MKLRDIGVPVEPPKRECDNPNCPFHGTLPVRGRILEGVVVSDDMTDSIVIRRDYLHYVPKYLSENGFNITPVNPTTDKILDKKCYQSVVDVEDSIDIVDVFRPSDQVLPIVKEAIKKKPKVIWLQEGIHNAEAEELARKEGIKVVFNRCMLAEHQRLF